MDVALYDRPPSLADSRRLWRLARQVSIGRRIREGADAEGDAPAMYRTFRDKHDACIKVVMKPGVTAPRHTDPPSSRQQCPAYGQIIPTRNDRQKHEHHTQ